MKRVLIGLCVIGVASAVSAQTFRSAQALSHFLESKQRTIEARRTALNALGRGADYSRLLQCVQNSAIPAPKGYPGATPLQAAALTQAFRHDLTGSVLAAGLQLGACERNATQMAIAAAARGLRASSQLEDHVLLSDVIVVARATGGADVGGVDGFRSGQVFLVTSPIKGDVRKGTRLALRLRGGRNPDGTYTRYSNEPSFKTGSEYLLLVSRSLYEVTVLETGRQKPRSDEQLPGVLMTIPPELAGPGREQRRHAVERAVATQRGGR